MLLHHTEAIAVATGTPRPLCRSLILLKHTQQQASCAFRTLLSSLRDTMQNVKQASEGYDTFGGDAIELHPKNFQVHCCCVLSVSLVPCLLPAPAYQIDIHHHCTRWLHLPTIYSPVGGNILKVPNKVVAYLANVEKKLRQGSQPATGQ
jgi:hypothetical protein